MNNELLCVFEEYLSITKMLGSNTTSSYIGDLSSLQEFIGDKSLTLLSSEDIIDFLSQFSNKRTLNRKLSSINTFFRFCHEYNFEHSKVSIPMSKIPKNLPKYLPSQEIINNIKMIDQSTYFGLRDYALILFLYASGCRVSEALNIQKGDIIDGWLKIRFAKGEKERIVPLAPIAIKALDEYLEHQDMRNSYLWLNYKGEKLSRISAFKIVKKYLGVSPHVLRHSFASALIIGGADLRVVQELLGHSSLVTTQIYTHIQKQNLSDTMQSFHPLRSF